MPREIEVVDKYDRVVFRGRERVNYGDAAVGGIVFLLAFGAFILAWFILKGVFKLLFKVPVIGILLLLFGLAAGAAYMLVQSQPRTAFPPAPTAAAAPAAPAPAETSRPPQPTSQAWPFCQDGAIPEFRHGFASLQRELGVRMGEPLECEHLEPGSGDTHQATTLGLAYYRPATNTPAFTNGSEHWALTSQGFVYWIGDSPDPPLTAQVLREP